MDQGRWIELMGSIGFDENLDTFLALEKLYSRTKRYYHNKEHIRACLAEFDRCRNLAASPEEMELALWFHDAVYYTTSSHNEEESAQMAALFLSKHGFSRERTERVRQLILATKHGPFPLSGDCALIADIDLVVLGQEPAAYQAFEQAVRREYRWVPRMLYRRRRRRFLRAFLERENIYHSKWYRDKFELQARENLSQAVSALEGRR
jgi:predicted metal-dependent HD superfamily phosphohydrolase